MTDDEWHALLLAGITEAEILEQIDAGLHDPAPEVVAEFIRALSVPSAELLTTAHKIELTNTPVLVSFPKLTAQGRGRPAHIKPLPRLSAAKRTWRHKLVHLPDQRPGIAANNRASGAITADRVAAARAELRAEMHGEPSSPQVHDRLIGTSEITLRTVQRHMKKARE